MNLSHSLFSKILIMMFKQYKQLKAMLSTKTRKYYDLITIGQYANKVSQLSNSRLNSNLMTKLVIPNESTIFEQQLIHLQPTPYIHTDYNYYRKYGMDIQHTPVKSIHPETNKITLCDGSEVYYRQLVYSASNEAWKDVGCCPGLHQQIQTPSTFVYSDYKLNNIAELYKRTNGRIVFVIPEGKHFASQNYFMLHLQATIQKQLTSSDKPVQITIFNQNTHLFPENMQINQIITELLTSSGVEVKNNCKIANIDFIGQKITLGDSSCERYNALFHFLPVKNPDLLQKSSLDYKEINANNLNHNVYDNIYVMGNVVPTGYSFYAMNFMVHAITKSVMNSYLRINKKAIYEGQSFIPFWTSDTSLRYFHLDYQGIKQGNNIGSNPIIAKLLAKDKKMFAHKQIHLYLNGASYGLPYYFIQPKMQQTLINTQQKIEF